VKSAAVAAALALWPVAGIGADLPRATQKALADLKLDAGILDGLDAELKVPQAWVDGARKEGEAVVLGTWDNPDFDTMTAAFRERYPFVKLRYSRSGTTARGMRVLIALREGRVLADVTTSIADATFHFEKAKALADLRELPGYANVGRDFRADDGTWAAFKLSYRCMGYNKTLVKAADLPRTWDDLLTNPRWRGGNVALSNHPNAWLLNLWGGKGETWGEDFTRRLFDVLQPQKRKEGMSALTALTVAGEFHANIPAPEWRAQNLAEKGAPIGYHCPEPIPITLSQIVMLEKSPRKNAARMFINWMLSREGQLIQYAETSAVPVHKALQLPRFLPFPDTMLGKPVQVRNDALLESDLHRNMARAWERQWGPSGGQKKGKKKKTSSE
jgi:iron(III) transport system substrate-binding protein